MVRVGDSVSFRMARARDWSSCQRGQSSSGACAIWRKQAAPFDDDAVNIARADEVGDPGLFDGGIFVDGGDDLFRARAVFGRDAVFEITGDGLLAEELVAGDGEAARPAIFLAAKTKTSVEVGEVVDHFIEGIAGVFQSRRRWRGRRCGKRS